MDEALVLANSDLTLDELRDHSAHAFQSANFYDKHYKHRSIQAIHLEKQARMYARAVLIRALRDMGLENNHDH